MAVVTEQGIFALNTSTGNQTVPLANASLLGQAIIFWGGRNTVDGVTPDNRHYIGLGTATQGRGITMSDRDNVPTTAVSSKWSTNRIIQGLSLTYGVEFHATMVSMSAGQFVINVVNEPPSGFLVNYLIIGGLDNALVGNVTDLTNVLGNRSVTGVGFQGDVVIAASINADNDGISSELGATLNVGWAVSSSKRGSTQWNSKDNDPASSKANRRQQTNAFLIGADQTGAKIGEADFVSLDADGYTINVSNAWQSRTIHLVMKGGLWDAVSFNTLNAINTQQVPLPFPPVGILLMSNCNPSDNVNNTEHINNVFGGASSATRQSSITMLSQDNVPTSSTWIGQNDTEIYVNRLSSNGSVRGIFEVQSFDVDGVTFSETDDDNDTNEVLMLAVGNPVLGSSKLVDDNPLLGNKLIEGTLIG